MQQVAPSFPTAIGGEEESPGNTERHASEREDIREGIALEQKTTTSANGGGKGEKVR